MQDDVAAIKDWATVFQSKAKLAATVSKNYLLHKRAIKTDIANVKADWALDHYYKSGVDAADLVNLAVGPIKKTVV